MTVNFVTLAISIEGIVISSLYIILRLFSVVDKGYDEKLKQDILNWIRNTGENSNNEKMKILLKDYETANAEIGRRDNITLLVGTILITASLLILGNIATTNSANHTDSIAVYALVSIGLFTIWLFVLHETNNRIDAHSYKRIKAIEEALTNYLGYDFGIHSYIYKKTRAEGENDKPIWWLKVRRVFWGIILFLLSLTWMLLSVK